jgi:hypothetical protein
MTDYTVILEWQPIETPDKSMSLDTEFRRQLALNQLVDLLLEMVDDPLDEAPVSDLVQPSQTELITLFES